MNIIVLVLIIAAMLFLFGIIFMIRKIRERRIANNIPMHVLDLFNEAERRYKLDGGNTNPYKILREVVRDSDSAIARARSSGIHETIREQYDVQTYSPTEDGFSSSVNTRTDKNNSNSFLSRIRRS
jgi:hypothetical protein